MRIDLLEAFGLDPNVIAILKQKYDERLLPIQERAFKECQILNGGNFLLSAVTSSGKTLVGEILALKRGGFCCSNNQTNIERVFAFHLRLT